MEVLKEHKGKVFASALIAIIGVGLGVIYGIDRLVHSPSPPV